MSNVDNLKYFRSWEKQQLVVFEKEDQRVYLVVEYNQFYGELITAFQIGDKSHDTGVESRYTGNTLLCQESGSLCGVREFEKGSIIYEFLCKPLGIEVNQRIISQFFPFKTKLEEKGWKQVRRTYDHPRTG